MPVITPADASQCVRDALAQVADFSGSIDSFTFEFWHQYHKTVFINAVALCISKKGNRIILNEGMLANTMTMAQFTAFVVNNSGPLPDQPKPPLTVSNGNLKQGG